MDQTQVLDDDQHHQQDDIMMPNLSQPAFVNLSGEKVHEE